jgi:hypothetical protein
MIIGVPDHQGLSATGIGWMNLAWSSIIDCITDVDDHSEYLQSDLLLDDEKTRKRIARIIQGQRFKINNAITLLQQSLEILLKSRIAETSPFLLIHGDPQSWPKPNDRGEVDFTDFRTVDAVSLCKAANTVGQRPLPAGFIKFFEDLRKARNKITHLTTSGVSADAVADVMLSIITAHHYMFDGQAWQRFRKDYMYDRGPTVEGDTDEDDIYETDYTYDQFLREIDCVLRTLQPADLKRFLGFDAERERLYCHNCYNETTKYYDGEHLFAQKQDDGSIFCVACLIKYADDGTYETFGQIV